MLCVVLLAVAPAVAEEQGVWPENLQLHGFLSQGYVKTSDNRFFGDSDEGSWDFREIGANLSYQPMPNLLFAGQLLSRTAGELYDGSVRLDYGLVDFTAVMEADRRLGVCVGRLKNPLGFYSDTRDVPFTRPSVFLPQSIYFDRVRNLELSADGLGVYSDTQIAPSDLVRLVMPCQTPRGTHPGGRPTAVSRIIAPRACKPSATPWPVPLERPLRSTGFPSLTSVDKLLRIFIPVCLKDPGLASDKAYRLADPGTKWCMM